MKKKAMKLNELSALSTWEGKKGNVKDEKLFLYSSCSGFLLPVPADVFGTTHNMTSYPSCKDIWQPLTRGTIHLSNIYDVMIKGTQRAYKSSAGLEKNKRMEQLEQVMIWSGLQVCACKNNNRKLGCVAHVWIPPPPLRCVPPGCVPVYASFSAFSAPFIWYPTCII